MPAPYYDATTDSRTLEGDSFGGCEARLPIPPAPSAAKRMDFVFRACFDTITLNSTTTPEIVEPSAWNQSCAFGLSFDGSIPKYPASLAYPDLYAPTGFLGWFSPAPFYDYYGTYGTAGTYAHAVAIAMGYGDFATIGGRSVTSASAFKRVSFADGLGNVINYVNTGPGGVTTDKRARLVLPKNVTLAAAYTFGWRIYASHADKSVYLLTAYNAASLAAGEALFDVFTSPATSSSLTTQLHGDVTSAFRPSFDSLVLPPWLVMRYPHPNYALRFKTGAVRYYDWNDQELPAAA